MKNVKVGDTLKAIERNEHFVKVVVGGCFSWC